MADCYNVDMKQRIHGRKEKIYVTSRQMDILYYLHEQDGFVTVSDISGVIQVSVKTIRNELIVIQEAIEQENLGRLEKKPHEGVRLLVEDRDWEKLKRLLEDRSPVTDQLDVKSQIIYFLLTRGSLGLGEIQKELYTGRSSVERLIPELQNWFGGFGILFEKKRGKGFQIEYGEYQWRMAMWNLFLMMKRKSRKELFNRGQGAGQSGEYILIEDFLKGFDTSGINKEIYSLEEYYGFSFAYEAHIQMFFLLSLCIVRSRKKQFVTMPKPQRCKVEGRFSARIKGRLIEALERGYRIKLPPCEQEFIEFIIDISDIQNFQDMDRMLECQADHMELCYFSIRLISLVSDIVNVDLRPDLFFSEGLFLQLRSMIARLRYNVKTVNPLLKQVKQKYPNIFAAIYAVGVYFEKELNLELNEHEMCSLALLLGGAIERSLSAVTACVVCDYGIGISQRLREQLERTVSDIRIADVLSVRDLKKVGSIPCDLIITTVQIKSPYFGREVVVVDHLMTQYDVRNVENKMKQVRRRKLKTKQPCNQLCIQKNLFYEEFIHLQMEAEDKGQLIKVLCKQLTDAGYVTDGFERSVLEHEVTAPTALGEGVAIPHGYAKYVIRPTVAVAVLKQPVRWQEDVDADVIFLLAFNLDEAAGMKEETIKFYSVFLDLLDCQEEVEAIRKMEHGRDLAELMNQRIREAVNCEDRS